MLIYLESAPNHEHFCIKTFIYIFNTKILLNKMYVKRSLRFQSHLDGVASGKLRFLELGLPDFNFRG
jgi:hypothetical protein